MTPARQYEFYEYTGEVNPEDNEAQPSFTGDGCEADPASPDCDIVGNYLGAQMAAAVLGLGDVLDIATQSPVMAGQVGVNYLLMLTAVGGTGPYSWSLTAGTMFAGLGLTGDGWISGMPIESGTRTFEINLEDADGTIVAKNLTLTIVGPSSEPTVAPTSTPTNLSTPEPTYIPTSSPTQHPVVNPPPTQNPVKTSPSFCNPSQLVPCQLQHECTNEFSKVRLDTCCGVEVFATDGAHLGGRNSADFSRPTSPSPTTNSPTTSSPTIYSSKTNPPTTSVTNGSQLSYGSLSNWDTYCVVPSSTPGEYEDCHGFEVELEDLPCSNVYYTFSYNRYGAPDKSDTATGGCIVSYVSSYDSVNSQWLVTTPVPSSLLLGGKVTPTNGHSCFSSGQSDYATSGCEHFGVSLGGKNPTATKYRWLIANPAIPGTLMHASTKVGIPAVTWNVRPNAGVNGGNVVAAVIEAEPPEPVCGLCSKWGEPRWVKVFKTEIEYEVDLDHLLTDSDEVPQSSSETEMEWVLLQARPTCDNDWPCAEVPFNASENELALEEEANDASKTVIRRYEFYEYTGEV
ncbi:hypothetical protein ACHAXS_001608, partial [Conticribra weissflogii]